jgi:hypothetical protein
MVSDLPRALVDVLSAMERDRLGYVLYRDPKSDRRLVILVEGPSDVAVIKAALGTAGVEPAAGDAGHDFVVHPTEPDSSTQPYIVQFKFTSGETNIANLLWLAATDEGAATARNSIQRSS